MVIMFAGAYFTYSASGVPFWSNSIVSNTIILGSAMILYMFFMSMAIVHFWVTSKKTGIITVVFLGAVDALLFCNTFVTCLLVSYKIGYI